MMDGLDRTVAGLPRTLVGSWRRFGIEGPVYQVVSTGSVSVADRPTLRIRVLESGEELDYPVAKALSDPQEH